jgi:bifunctional DNase/RNase
VLTTTSGKQVLQNERIADEARGIGQSLDRQIKNGKPFVSRVFITVQSKTAINMKHCFQPLRVETYQIENTIFEAIDHFVKFVIDQLAEHSFFTAWIEISYDGQKTTINPAACESSVRF